MHEIPVQDQAGRRVINCLRNDLRDHQALVSTSRESSRGPCSTYITINEVWGSLGIPLPLASWRDGVGGGGAGV